jgi:oxygen-independent coproporphyrinogen-3 oxidase
MSGTSSEATRAGGYFVSNYPPYDTWDPEGAAAALATLDRPYDREVPLGLYVHVPFCRRRCEFCFYRVYTDKNARDVGRYSDCVLRELEAHARLSYLAGRKPRFVYFGGGTPSYLSTDQLRRLTDGMRAILPWDEVREVAFECEPGTMVGSKFDVLRDAGVTRLSLGVEAFDPRVLELNGRAHGVREIYTAFERAREVGFPQINLDLIAGMIGETEETWSEAVRETLALAPESVTVYQMEVPHNTRLARRMRESGEEEAPVPDWDTKRRWVRQAFDAFLAAGYRQSSAYTVCRDVEVEFLYRDALWHGATMLGVGVSSFSHHEGVHFQNESSFENYCDRVEAGELPLTRGHVMTPEERFRREFVLQMKLGRVAASYFSDKFGIDPRARFAAELAGHVAAGWITVEGDTIAATPEGLLRVDGLVPAFYLPEHRLAG